MTTAETMNHLAPYEPLRAQIAELKAAHGGSGVNTPYGSSVEKRMKIELKPHRWPFYFVWFIFTPALFVAGFTAPLWAQDFWALGGWHGDDCVFMTELWLFLVGSLSNIAAGGVVLERYGHGSGRKW